MHALSTDERAPCAADAAWLAENSRGLAAAATGDWAEAVEAFATAAELATGDDASTHDALALVLNNLAQASFRAGQLDDGIRHAQRACALRAALAGEDAITVARARADLAVMLGAVGRSDEGRALTARAVAGIERIAGDEDVRLCSVLENAARLAVAAGQLSSAEPLLLRLHALLAIHDLPTTTADTLLAHIAQHRQAPRPPRFDAVSEGTSAVVSAPSVVLETTDSPTVAEAVVASLVVDAPVVESFVADSLAADSLVVESLVTESLVSEPVIEEPVVVQGVESPLVEASVVEASVVEASVVEASVVEASVVEAPVVEAPVVEAPVVEAPVVEAPVVEAPIVEAAIVEAPVAPLELIVDEPAVVEPGSVANIEFDLADDFGSPPALTLDDSNDGSHDDSHDDSRDGSHHGSHHASHGGEPAAGAAVGTVDALAFVDVLDLDDGRADDILGNVSFDLIELEPPVAPARPGPALETPVEAPVLDVLGFTVEYGTPTELDYTSPSDAIIAPPPSRRIATPATGTDARVADTYGRAHPGESGPAAPSHESPRAAASPSPSPSAPADGSAPSAAPYLTLHQSGDDHRDRRGKLRAGRASAPQSSGGVMIAGAVTASVAAALAWLAFAGG
jgi:hypothetical protein